MRDGAREVLLLVHSSVDLATGFVGSFENNPEVYLLNFY